MATMHDGVCYILLLQYPNGRVAFPKGRQEAGETLEETALREVEEETGMTGLQIVQKLGEVQYRSNNPTQSMYLKTMHIFLMTAQDATGNAEHACVWMPLEEAQTAMELEGERDLLVQNADVIRKNLSAEALWF